MLADKSGLRPKGHGKLAKTKSDSKLDNELAEYNKKLGEKLRLRRMTPEQIATEIRTKIEQHKLNINGKQ